MTHEQPIHVETGPHQSAARDALDARIVAETQRLVRAESELQRERKREEDLAFAAQKLASELRATISGMRQSMADHHRIVVTIGQVLSECVRVLDERRTEGEAARSVQKTRMVCVSYAENLLAQEYKLGFISAHSRVGKMINEVQWEMDRRENRARSAISMQHHIEFVGEKDLPATMHHSDRILATLADPSSCRRLGFVSRTLTRSILALTESMLPGRNDDSKKGVALTWGFLPLLRVLAYIHAKLYERKVINRNTREFLSHAAIDDKRISRILGKPVSAMEEYFRSRHEILKWNEAVKRLPGDLPRLKQLRKEWRIQTQVSRTVAAQREQCAVALKSAKTEYESSFEVPWRPRTKGPVEAGTPAIPRQRVPKKLRDAPAYAKKHESPKPDERDSVSFSVRETDQWRSDLKELPEDSRRTFSDAAKSISRLEPRKPIGSSRGRTFYSIPLGDAGRIVYSIDSGIAILERAFGKPSRTEDYRKYRKDIQKGRI